MKAYYNEIDPYCVQWLRNLIDAGLIAGGDVDDRSIAEVQPDDLKGYTQCHFFAGLGGWSNALRLALWPDDRHVWTGSCPCQPFSAAGKQEGTDDSRHLWPQWFRLIESCRPPIIFGEQVASAAVIGKVQGVRGGKASRGVSPSQQRRFTWDVPGLRERSGSENEAMEIGTEARISNGEAADASRFFSSQRCEAEGEGQGHPVRSGLARHSGADRVGVVRGYGTAVRSGNAEGLERSVARSEETTSGIHEGEYEGSSLCSEHDGERMGREPDPDYCGGNPKETVLGCVERLIAAPGREPENPTGGAWLDVVQNDLERARYTVGASVLAACSVSAPHIRQRLWFVAHTEHAERRAECEIDADTHGRDGLGGSGDIGLMGNASVAGRKGGENGGYPVSTQQSPAERASGHANPWSNLTWLPCTDGKQRPTGCVVDDEGEQMGLPGRSRQHGEANGQGSTQSIIQPLAHGIPKRVAKLRAIGNAIVPQIATEFIKAADVA